MSNPQNDTTVNNLNTLENFALHQAIIRNDFAEVTRLVESGSSLTVPNADGYFPLNLAVMASAVGIETDIDVEMVCYLLDHGAPVDFRTNNGSKVTAWEQAAIHYNKPRILNEFNRRNAALHDAIVQRDLAAVKRLVQTGSSLIIHNAGGYYPLNLAVMASAVGVETDVDVEMVRYLLDHGAPVDFRTNNGSKVTAKEQASKYYNKPRILNEFNRRNAELHKAIIHNDLPAVKRSVESGSSLIAPNADGYFPLNLAVMASGVEMVSYLLDKGAPINLKAVSGVTPLQQAVVYNKPAILQKLISLGASINVIDHLGDYPLHYAIRHNQFDIVKILVEAGAKLGIGILGIPDAKGYYPLNLAVMASGVEMVTYLLDKGAPIDLKAVSGVTPLQQAPIYGKTVILNEMNRRNTELHQAIIRNDLPAVKRLVETGSSLTAPAAAPVEGYYPLNLAVMASGVEMVSYLLDKGAPVDLRTQNGSRVTALEQALVYGKPTVFNKLISHKAGLPITFQKESETQWRFLCTLPSSKQFQFEIKEFHKQQKHEIKTLSDEIIISLSSELITENIEQLTYLPAHERKTAAIAILGGKIIADFQSSHPKPESNASNDAVNDQINLTDWHNMILSNDLRIEYNHDIYSDYIKPTYNKVNQVANIVCPVVKALPPFVINALHLGKASKLCDSIKRGTTVIDKHLDGEDWLTITIDEAADYAVKWAAMRVISSLGKLAMPVTVFCKIFFYGATSEPNMLATTQSLPTGTPINGQKFLDVLLTSRLSNTDLTTKDSPQKSVLFKKYQQLTVFDPNLKKIPDNVAVTPTKPLFFPPPRTPSPTPYLVGNGNIAVTANVTISGSVGGNNPKEVGKQIAGHGKEINRFAKEAVKEVIKKPFRKIGIKF